MASGDRSDKIRTYNFPQSRITGPIYKCHLLIWNLDHRTGLTLYGIEKMLGGELLEQFIEEYSKKVFNDKIVALLDEEGN